MQCSLFEAKLSDYLDGQLVRVPVVTCSFTYGAELEAVHVTLVTTRPLDFDEAAR